jgi:mevalonate pyrophosphate decarboxylase
MAKVSAHVAQSVEHFLGKEEVTGSIPVMSTISSAIKAGPETGRFLSIH